MSGPATAMYRGLGSRAQWRQLRTAVAARPLSTTTYRGAAAACVKHEELQTIRTTTHLCRVTITRHVAATIGNRQRFCVQGVSTVTLSSVLRCEVSETRADSGAVPVSCTRAILSAACQSTAWNLVVASLVFVVSDSWRNTIDLGNRCGSRRTSAGN